MPHIDTAIISPLNEHLNQPVSFSSDISIIPVATDNFTIMPGKPMSKSDMFTTPSHDQHQSILFGLPGELRTYIYELVLVSGVARQPFGVVHVSKTTAYERLRQRSKSVLTLLETCRRIYQEAVGIFYEQIHLSFTSAGSSRPLGPELFWSLSLERLQAIKTLYISKSLVDDIASLCRRISKLPNVQYLSFWLTGHDTDSLARLLTRINESKPGFLRALQSMDSLRTLDLTFWREDDASEEERRSVEDFVAELNAVLPYNCNRSDKLLSGKLASSTG